MRGCLSHRGRWAVKEIHVVGAMSPFFWPHMMDGWAHAYRSVLFLIGGLLRHHGAMLRQLESDRGRGTRATQGAGDTCTTSTRNRGGNVVWVQWLLL